ncbi:hypothetical protein V8C86DRAFT_2446634, partial [Haematococcus lacustris]
ARGVTAKQLMDVMGLNPSSANRRLLQLKDQGLGYKVFTDSHVLNQLQQLGLASPLTHQELAPLPMSMCSSPVSSGLDDWGDSVHDEAFGDWAFDFCHSAQAFVPSAPRTGDGAGNTFKMYRNTVAKKPIVSKPPAKKYKHHAPNADKPFSVLGKYEQDAVSLWGKFAPEYIRMWCPRSVGQYTIPGCVPGEYPKLGSNSVEARWNVPMRAIIGLVWKEFTKANPAYLALLSYWMLLAAFKKW